MNLSRIVKDLRLACEPRWPTPSPSDSLLWVFTEAGELADECMRLPGFADVEPTRNHPREGKLGKVKEEAADVLIMLTTLCNSLGIDIELAFVMRVRELHEKYGGES